jgi:hypothetical protein
VRRTIDAAIRSANVLVYELRSEILNYRAGDVGLVPPTLGSGVVGRWIIDVQLVGLRIVERTELDGAARARSKLISSTATATTDTCSAYSLFLIITILPPRKT